MAWRAAPVLAEAIIASPQIPDESIDAHLIRIVARLLVTGRIRRGDAQDLEIGPVAFRLLILTA